MTGAARRMKRFPNRAWVLILIVPFCVYGVLLQMIGSLNQDYLQQEKLSDSFNSSIVQKAEDKTLNSSNYEEEIRSLKHKLEISQKELSSIKLKHAAAIRSVGGNTPNFTVSDKPDPNEFHRFEHLVTTSKWLNQSRTKNLLHMDPVMRRSRPVIGNTERIHGFINKLLQGKCMNVLFVGGSVTFAFPRGKDGSLVQGYHLWFVKWLNERYPCNGGEHKLSIHGPGGTDAAYAVSNFNQLFRDVGGPVDFISFEYAVNDSSMAVKPGKSLGESIQIVNEILFRKALKYRNPQDGSAPAIISLETSFWVGNMINKKMRSTYDAVHVFTPAYHFPITTYYDVPSISVAQVWFPMFAKDLEQHSNKSSEIFGVFQDMCHPSATKGHFVIAQILAYNIEVEKAWMLNNKDSPRHRLEQDLTLEDPPKLPNPWWLTDEEEALLVDAPVSEFDFQKFQPSSDSLNDNTGWSIYDDSANKNKFGLIATKSASHVSFKVELTNFNRTSFKGVTGGDAEAFKKTKQRNAQSTPTNTISLGYLRSYSNVSDAMVWTDDNPEGHDICHSTVVMSNFTAEVKFEVGVWSFRQGAGRGVLVHGNHGSKTSVFNSYTVPLSELALDAAEQGKAIYLHVCNLPFDLAANRTIPYTPVDGDSKFKVLLVMAINGHLGIKKSGELHSNISKQ
eukprot:scaffold23001_cov46-Cyclotella_meneghiniana.AAC.4